MPSKIRRRFDSLVRRHRQFVCEIARLLENESTKAHRTAATGPLHCDSDWCAALHAQIHTHKPTIAEQLLQLYRRRLNVLVLVDRAEPCRRSFDFFVSTSTQTHTHTTSCFYKSKHQIRLLDVLSNMHTVELGQERAIGLVSTFAGIKEEIRTAMNLSIMSLTFDFFFVVFLVLECT